MASYSVETYQPGAVIFEEGTMGQVAYIVKSGEVGIYTTQGNKRVELGTANKGNCFGEMALILTGKRTATVIANSLVELYAIDKSNFDELIKGANPLLRVILNSMVKRVMESNKRSNKNVRAVNPLLALSHLLVLMGEPKADREGLATLNVAEVRRQAVPLLGINTAEVMDFLNIYSRLHLVKLNPEHNAREVTFTPGTLVKTLEDMKDFLPNNDQLASHAQLEIVGIDQIAELLSIKPDNVIDAIRRKAIPSSAVMFRKTPIMKLLQEHGKNYF